MLENFFVLQNLRIVISIVMLVSASLVDYKKREINDLWWVVFSAISIVLLFVNSDFWSTLKTTGISLMVAPIALVLWRFGMFGGADALCLIVLATLSPMASLNAVQITPFTTLTNASILTIVPLLVNLGRNLFSIFRGNDIFYNVQESTLKKTFALFVGYKAKNPKHSFCIEHVIDGKKYLDFSLKNAEKMSFCSGTDIWVTPGLPFVLYITGGFVLQITCGDLILNFVHYLF